MTESEWLSIAAHISRMWPNDPLAPDTAAAWYPLLADLPADTVRVAVNELRLDPAVRWQPTPGQIRDGCTADIAAWSDVIPEIGRRLAGNPANDDHPNAGAVTAYIRSLTGPHGRRDVRWDPADPTTRAQLRDWWTDWHRRRARTARRDVARQVAAPSGAPAIEVPA